MASRLKSATLWTLVSVNIITLVVGGLVTWLGYAIPVRLKQFGLLPELTIIAGFASLIVACLGLCALNYSSHHALSVYGFSCAIFVLLLLFGLPDAWYKSSQFGNGNLVLDSIYFFLLFLLLVLLLSAFALAHHLRRKELLDLEESGGADALACQSPACTCTRLTALDGLGALAVGPSIMGQQHQLAGRTHRLDCSSLSRPSSSCRGHRHRRRYLDGLDGHSRQPQTFDHQLSRLSGFRTPNQHDHRQQQQQQQLAQYAPLKHQGFYYQQHQDQPISSLGRLVGRKPNKRPLVDSDEPSELDDDDERSSPDSDKPKGPAGSIKSVPANPSWLLGGQPTSTRDDSSIQYGPASGRHGHLRAGHLRPGGPSAASSPMRRDCRCRQLRGVCSSAASLVARLQASSPMMMMTGHRAKCHRTHSSPYTMPAGEFVGPNPSAHATRSRPTAKRTNGASSVMAMTAAAAAALLGGPVDGSALAGHGDGLGETDAGLFEELGGQESSAFMDDNQRCAAFYNNDNDLEIEMLIDQQHQSANSVSQMRQTLASQQPVLDFAPLLDIRH